MGIREVKFIVFTAKLFAFMIAAYAFTIAFPSYSHIVVLVISLILLSLGISSLAVYKGLQKWQQATAEIKSIKELEEDMTEYRNSYKYYYPEIEYKYSYEGNEFIGDCVSFEKENTWVAEVNNWGYPIQKQTDGGLG